jgi:hypothetical protein
MSARTLFVGSLPDASATSSRAFTLPDPGTSNPRGFKASRTWIPKTEATAVIASATASTRQGRRSMSEARAESIRPRQERRRGFFP